MSREYATRDNGERVLLWATCDYPGCEETIHPHSDIASSGWTKTGSDDGPGTDRCEQDWCPLHS